eukprot:jgi/Undpi1/13591/HiC_scaffold_84.g14097.m1
MPIQGCWHLPAGGEDDWLCIDVPRGLEMGLDTLPVPRRKTPPNGAQTPQGVGDGHVSSSSAGDNAPSTAVAAEVVADLEDGEVGESGAREEKGGASDDKMREHHHYEPLPPSPISPPTPLRLPPTNHHQVGGLLQSMRVKRRASSGSRYSTQGTVEEAAKVAEAVAARAKVAAATAAAAAATAPGTAPRKSSSKTTVTDTASRKKWSNLNGNPENDGEPTPRSSSDFPEGGGGRTKAEARIASPQNNGNVVNNEGADVNSSAGFSEGEGVITSGDAVDMSPVGLENVEAPLDGDSSGVAGDLGGVVKGADGGLGDSGEALRRGGEELPIGSPPDEGDAAVGEGVGEGREWASMTVVALKEELRKRGLKVSGRKAELVARLLET